MSPWTAPDQARRIAEATERPRPSEDLVAEIADALAASGEYVALVDPEPTQRVVDFNWAARQAARSLGVRVDVETKLTRTALDGKAEIRVTPVEPPS